MKTIYFLLILLTVFIFSCKKETFTYESTITPTSCPLCSEVKKIEGTYRGTANGLIIDPHNQNGDSITVIVKQIFNKISPIEDSTIIYVDVKIIPDDSTLTERSYKLYLPYGIGKAELTNETSGDYRTINFSSSITQNQIKIYDYRVGYKWLTSGALFLDLEATR